MENKMYKVLIFSALFLIVLASCTLPSSQDPGVQTPPANPQPEEPITQEEESPTRESASEPSTPVEEEAPSGGGSEPLDEPGAQNPLPPAVNLEKSSIDLEKLGKDIVGGGGGNNCSESLGIKTEREITLWFDGLADEWKLCFINFPVGTAQVQLSTQSGVFDTSVALNPEFDGVEAYGLYINLPASIRRDGALKVEFNVGDVTFMETFDIQTINQVSIHQDHIDILDAEYQTHPGFNIGEKIELFGSRLSPSTTVYVGIYGITEFDNYYFHPLIDQFEVTTNEAGEFLGAIQITEKYHLGRYVIYYGYDPGLLENRRFEHKYDKFTVSGTSPTWQPCPATYPSRLRLGDVGFVSDDPFSPNNVRNIPSLAGKVVGQIQPREHFIILDGPVCDGGWIWWYVQGTYDFEKDEALMGWTSEGDVDNYWLVKAPGN